MTEQYEPELGQSLFGQPTQEYEIRDSVILGLTLIGEYLYAKLKINPTENAAARYSNNVFEMYAYDWSDEEQPYNFKWKDFEVSWYKYLGRGTSMNKEISEDEVSQMIQQCIDSIAKDK